MRSNTITAAAAGIVATLATPASAFFRMSCPGSILLERADPIVSPGEVAGHVHTISGGNGFGFSMTYDQARASTCSSCLVKADLSNYWTPKLYFQAQDGTFEDVPQHGEGSGNTGGMTVYYLQRYSPESNELQAFPEGFRMVAGNPFQRSDTGRKEAPGSAVSFVCLNYDEGSTHHTSIPDRKCPSGLRAQVFFPSCWDGVNLDSADHRSHMSYPIGEYDNGYCPDSHPVRMVSLFYEVIYSIDRFDSRWETSDGHPFVFAQGDATGFGFHGDFVNGWDIDVLQEAVDTCTAQSGNLEDCPVFVGEMYTPSECQSCRVPPSVDERVTGVLQSLPGCNPVTTGPANAVPETCTSTPIGNPQQYYTDVTSLGWQYEGCGRDGGSRTFPASFDYSQTMTVQECVQLCASKNFTMAGLQWYDQCFCDDDYRVDGRAPQAGVLGECHTPCVGDADQICGGPNALSVYKACEPEDCQNSDYVGPNAGSQRLAKRHSDRQVRRGSVMGL